MTRGLIPFGFSIYAWKIVFYELLFLLVLVMMHLWLLLFPLGLGWLF
jgi:hypothetical protein